MTDVLASIGVRCYRAVLFLYPARFRQQFQIEMARDFEDASHDALAAHRRSIALVALWMLVAGDLVRTLAIQWLRTGLPLVALVAAFATSGTVSVLAWIWPAEPAVFPSGDSDLMLLVLIVSVVMLVIVATIVFSLWFLRPLVYRRRH
jgi:hypothetical protein